MKKTEQLQSGFGSFLQDPEQKKNAAPVVPARRPEETFSKHNLFFSDDLFQKIKVLQARSGKSQREVLDTIIRQYVEDFEKKHGELVAETLDL